MKPNEKSLMISITKDIGKLQLRYFPRDSRLKSKVKSKYFNDIVTKVDILAEKMVFKKLKKSGYKGRLLIEESGDIRLGEDDKKIIIDPLDGTFFYSRGLSNFCVATTFEIGSSIVMSTVLNPFSQEFFMAEKGKGSFLNGKKIRVSETKDLNKSTIILSAFPNHQIDKLQKIFVKMMTTGGLRLLEHVLNLNLCYIASGRYDGYISFYSKLPLWDKLPGMLILREAGGVITDFEGRDVKNDVVKFVASNGKLHKKILEFVK
jgi:myo-inositol-1(or 4)-monophosphatase